MINRPNKVFYLSNELNFLHSLFSIENYKEAMIKALSSGFGPFPIVSVKVVDKVATVDIGEKATLYGGVKISIDGTGVGAIDTWHEIDNVSGNTFTFNVEAPNGNYTNGVTLSYPSLGWTLADRDANNLLFRSGSSGTQAHYVRLIFNKDRPANWPDSEKWRNTLTVQKVECDGTLNSIRMFIPSTYSVGIYLVTEVNAPASMNWQWYFYGDDAWVTMGHKGYWFPGTLYSKRANFWQCSFGELAKTAYKNGHFVINGIENPAYFWINPYTPSGHSPTSAGYSGFLGGNLGNFSATMVLCGQGNENNSYTDQFASTSTAPLWGSDSRSGYNFNTQVAKYVNNNMYGRITIWNRAYDYMGEVPGINLCVHTPNMGAAWTRFTPENGVDVIESFLKPVVCPGKLDKRKVYAFFSGGYNMYQAASNSNSEIYWPYQSSALMDLTGPIR